MLYRSCLSVDIHTFNDYNSQPMFKFDTILVSTS